MGIVYVLTNPVMPGLVKIGRTDRDDAGMRLRELYSTGVPVPFETRFAARVEDAVAVERALHEAFAPYRINPKREFFLLEPEQPIAILKLLNVQDATREIGGEVVAGIDSESIHAGRQQRARRPNLNFDEMGIPHGSHLHLVADESVTVEVIDARRVRFGDEETSLTAATKQALGMPYSVAPAPHWKYNGTVLREIYNKTYELSE